MSYQFEKSWKRFIIKNVVDAACLCRNIGSKQGGHVVSFACLLFEYAFLCMFRKNDIYFDQNLLDHCLGRQFLLTVNIKIPFYQQTNKCIHSERNDGFDKVFVSNLVV